MGHSEEDRGRAPPRWTGPTNASATHVDAVHTPDGTACLTATPRVARCALPTSGATTKEAHGRGIVADTPADKTTPVGGATQDCGRPTARG